MSFFKKLFGRKDKKEEIIEEKVQQPIEQQAHDVSYESEEEVQVEQELIEETYQEHITPEDKQQINKSDLSNIEQELADETQVEDTEESREEDTQELESNEIEDENQKVDSSAQKADEEIIGEVREVLEEAVEQVIEEVEKVETEEILEDTQEVLEETILETVLEEPVEEVEPLIEAEQVVEEDKPKKKGIFSKLFSGLAKTRDNILGSVDEVLKNFKKIDEDLYEELEEALIMADFGVDTTLTIMEELRKLVKERKIVDPNELKMTIQEIITNILTAHVTTPIIDETRPNVVLVIGVNGVGKTTTIGKLAHQLETDNKKVVLAAADTFRAAAIEQLQIWADRAHVDLIKHEEGSDPASVVYDGIKAAKARKADVLICDTAGRLQNKANLMKELEKISRIIEREYPEAHKEVLIVLDATTGQNAISQVKVFKEAAKVDGIVLTKLDGTAKGGAVVGICQSMGVPVKYIGVGEKIEDLQVFDPQSFARALFNVE